MHFADSSTQDSAGIPLEHKTECTKSHFNSAAFLIAVCMYLGNKYVEGKQLYEANASHIASLFVSKR